MGMRANYFKDALLLICLLSGCGAYEIDSQAVVVQIFPKDAYAMSAQNQAVIIDVRKDSEWEENHIPGAIHVPLEQLQDRLTELAAYKNTPLIIQCQHEGLSVKAAAIMVAAGFTRLLNLEGGLMAWEEAGLKTTR